VAPRGRHVGIAEHSRDLLHPRFAFYDGHIARRDSTLLAFCYNQVLIGVHGDLRKVRDHERLPAFA